MTIQTQLQEFRNKRKFCPQTYIEEKIKSINDFFIVEGLDCAVLGVSGGIDSAVVAKLFDLAMEQENSPIKKVIAFTLPVEKGVGTTNQDVSRNDSLLFSLLNLNNFNVLQHYMGDVVESLTRGFDANEWAIGQSIPMLRTAMFYFLAAKMQQEGFKSIVVGTMNYSEGSYIGYYGKGSDAMVDLQPIADIFKSEVYQVARHLKICETIINKPPTGDVWDGKTDEELIGVDYDFLELYLYFKSGPPEEYITFYDSLSEEEQDVMFRKSIRVEKLHLKNAHKYRVGLPSHFIDLIPVDRSGNKWIMKYDN